jgi:hypothetical protein
MEKAVSPPRELRARRAVEVLEGVGTPGVWGRLAPNANEARAPLSELAKGASGARLTREAAAACKRLEGRK